MSKAASSFNLEVSTQRLEAFSDGVFAIAITLLILEIKVPTAEQLKNSSLFQYLWQQGPKYATYIFSFITIGIYWANHHYLFKLFTKTDHFFNLLNVLFLMSISFLPFPTGVLGDYIMQEEHRKTAVTFYSLGIYLPAFFWFTIWLYAIKGKRLIHPRLSDDFIRSMTRVYLFSNVVYLAAFFISLFHSLTAIIIGIVLTLFYLLPPPKPEFRE